VSSGEPSLVAPAKNSQILSGDFNIDFSTEILLVPFDFKFFYSSLITYVPNFT
jgi:hypothetical protein